MKVLSFIDHEFEDLEFWYPILRLREAGCDVIIAGPTKGEKYIGKYGVPALSDITYEDVDASEYDALLVPGGWAPDKIRRSPKVLEIVREMHADQKVIGHICHAGWVLASAKILSGIKVTSTPGIKDDMENAGAIWFDVPAMVDKNIVSAQRPPDLPEYMKLFIQALQL
ncbi:type 1 glutamine amidotransferase domain-containing protein [uncultured Cytophaga sp.]|uniref:type 1 glutamine amidotransferase domain-containing protein n=1 Tax=uncultured Cytophaga sp. TaxID=160238 RepID=UPI002616610F|nr:type 1 glutamine amidotransferase domain-containing protein [uncultured Cytophaga sp.]